MDEEVDVEVRGQHVSSSNDEVDVSFARGAFQKSSDDADVVDHENDALSLKVSSPDVDSDEDSEGLERNYLSAPGEELVEDVRRSRRREPEARRSMSMFEENGSEAALAFRIRIEEQRGRTIACELNSSA